VILTAVILVITMPHSDPMEADEAIPAPEEASAFPFGRRQRKIWR